MSTPNFYYKNRCIIVSDEDLEDGNVPAHEDQSNEFSLRSCPSFDLRDQPAKCSVLVAILTGAYYSGACIDYIERGYDGITDEKLEQAIEEELPAMNEFLDNIKEEYGYTEVTCMAVASNGEAFYREV